MSLEKTSPGVPKEAIESKSPPIKINTATPNLFPKSRSIKPISPKNEPSLDRPQYDPMDETQDWIIDDNRLITPPEEPK